MRTTIKLPARKLVWTLLVGFAIVLIPNFVMAADNICTLQVSPVTFPAYNPLVTSDTQTHGTVTFNCTQSNLITVQLGTGGSGSFSARYMSGPSQLSYNLFLDAAGQIIWGDGTGGSQFYSNSSPPSNVNVALQVYARIPARQTQATPGIYRDTVVVTIIYY